MVELPLSGVARRSPLGSGGGDPAHPLALRLSEGAVVWAGPPLLPRTLGISLWVLGGGFERHLFQGAPPSPRGASLALAPGERWPSGAPPPSVRGGRSSVVGGGIWGATAPQCARPFSRGGRSGRLGCRLFFVLFIFRCVTYRGAIRSLHSCLYERRHYTWCLAITTSRRAAFAVAYRRGRATDIDTGEHATSAAWRALTPCSPALA